GDNFNAVKGSLCNEPAAFRKGLRLASREGITDLVMESNAEQAIIVLDKRAISSTLLL
ncbi:unnamed protein product, partial [Musa banksii]